MNVTNDPPPWTLTITLWRRRESTALISGGRNKAPVGYAIDRQIRYVTGAQYQWSDRLATGLQFVYADHGKAKIDNDLLAGDYKGNDIFFFALNANWKF